jgi:hypothetical protein
MRDLAVGLLVLADLAGSQRKADAFTAIAVKSFANLMTVEWNVDSLKGAGHCLSPKIFFPFTSLRAIVDKDVAKFQGCLPSDYERHQVIAGWKHER